MYSPQDKQKGKVLYWKLSTASGVRKHESVYLKKK